jgi:hypothetical protein
MAGWREVIGSDLEKFRKDESGKTRTADEIIQAALDAALEADRQSGGKGRGGITDAQGNFTPIDDRQLANEILMQLKANAERNKGNTSISEDVYKKLGGKKSEGNFGKYINPSMYKYGNQIGQMVQGPEDKAPSKVLDRSLKVLPPEELARLREITQNPDSKLERYGYVDPVTGFQVDVNPFTGEIDWERVDDRAGFLNANNPNFPTDGGFEDTGGFGGTGGAGGGTGGSNYSLNPNDPKNAERKSAYDLLYQQFKQYGLESLVEPLKGLITSATPPSEFVIKLRETDAYKKRFAGNAARIAKGLAAISEAEYIGLEDQYQNIMRNYGLPDTYWKKDSMGTQEGFTNFIGNDVSAAELEDRIMSAQKRVINSNPEVSRALKQFYPEITNGDILAYTLDPTQGLDVIKRKITAAEIGGAALAQGLETGASRAEELAKYGVTKEQAQQGYQTAAEIVPRGGQLAAIYGESPYTQTTAEQEIFGLAGAAEASKKRKKLAGLEQAAFSGQAGTTQGALGRERAGAI